MRQHHRFALAGIALAASLLIAACDSSPDAKSDTDAEVAAEVESTAPAMVDDTSEADRTVTEDGAPMAMEAPVKAPAKGPAGDPVRGPGGLEEKCLSRVAQETGARVIGTNRIEESQAAIEIYVNVEGAQAPWKCLGNRNGSISEVMYTGSEGEL